jgi:hypothetical protein
VGNGGPAVKSIKFDTLRFWFKPPLAYVIVKVHQEVGNGGPAVKSIKFDTLRIFIFLVQTFHGLCYKQIMSRSPTAHKTERTRNKDGTLRKRRTDRNHVIYKITNLATGDAYVGLTRALGRAYVHSAEERLRKHCRDALNEGRNDRIHRSIRTYVSNPEHWQDHFKTEVLDVVRGKENGHAREMELIRALRPSLNTEGLR